MSKKLFLSFVFVVMAMTASAFAQGWTYYRNNDTTKYLAETEAYWIWNADLEVWDIPFSAPDADTHLIWTNASQVLWPSGPTLGVDSDRTIGKFGSESPPNTEMSLWGISVINPTGEVTIGACEGYWKSSDVLNLYAGGLTIVGNHNVNLTAQVNLRHDQTWDLGGKSVVMGLWSNYSHFDTAGHTLTIKNGTFNLGNTSSNFSGGGQFIISPGASIYLGGEITVDKDNSTTIVVRGTGTSDAERARVIIFGNNEIDPFPMIFETQAEYNIINATVNGGGFLGDISGAGGFSLDWTSDGPLTFWGNNTFEGDFLWSKDTPKSILVPGSHNAFGTGGFIIGEDWGRLTIGMEGSAPFTLDGNSYFRLSGNFTRFVGAGDFTLDMPVWSKTNRGSANIINNLDSGKNLIFKQGLQANVADTRDRAITLAGVVGATTLILAPITDTGDLSDPDKTHKTYINITGGIFTGDTDQHWQRSGSGTVENPWVDINGTTVVLDAINTYTGSTTVQKGAALFVNGSLAGTGNVSVQGEVLDSAGNASTLGGHGSIAGNVNMGKETVLSPGYKGLGSLSLEGNASFGENMTMSIVSPEVSLLVAGTLTLWNDWTLTLQPHAYWAAGEASDKLLILDCANFVGNSSNFTPSVFNNNTGIAGIGYDYVAGEGLYLTGVTSSIPEPTTCALLALGLCALLLRKRK